MPPHLLYSRRVLTPTGLHPAAVELHDEHIHAVHPHPPAGLPCDDLGDLVLMPGLVDCHVHINEPGRTEWEGFVTATRAAAAGGITTLVDMPLNSQPVTTTLAALDQKLQAAAGKLNVDCGFWGGVVPGNTAELAPMVAAGVLGFKAFLCDSGIDDFPASTARDLRAAMPVLAACGVPLLVHAELVDEHLALPTEPDPRAYTSWLHSRPQRFEDDAIALMIELARETGCHVHIVHLSSASALPMIRRAKAEGVRLTVETCPHYLCLTAEQVPPGQTVYKCAPPIREQANRELLWRGLADGTIDLVISDHSPCTPALKLPERGDFLEAWGGIASLQLGLANIWTEAQRRGFSLADVHRWMSTAPLALLGLPGARGQIAPGHQADLVAWDPSAAWTIRADALLHRHPITPYLGREVRGQVETVWLRGAPIWRDGASCADLTGQTVLRPAPSQQPPIMHPG
jgi:allantoinase